MTLNQETIRAPSFWQSGHRGSLFAAFFYTEVSFLVWIILGPLAVFIADEFKLNSAQVGILVALPILSGTLLRLPAGLFVDRFGPRRVGMVAQSFVLAALILLWAYGAPNITHFYYLAFLLGLAGVSFSVAMPLVSGWYPPEHQGKALGIAALGGSGTFLSAMLAPGLAEAYGWQAVFGFAVVPVLAALAVYFVMAKETPDRPPKQTLSQYLLVLKYGDTLWFSFFYAVTFGGFVSFASSLVVYFHDQFQVSPVTAGVLLAVCILFGTLFRPVGGWLADRFGGIRTLQITFGVVAASLLLLSVGPQAVVALSMACILAAMTALGMGNGALFQLIPLRFYRQMGVVTGLVGTAGGLGGFLLTLGFGLLREETGQYQTGFFLYAALSVIALAGLWSVKRRWRTTWGAPHITSAKV